MSDADGENKQEEVEAEAPPGTTEEEEPALEGERRFSLQQIFSIFAFAPSFLFFHAPRDLTRSILLPPRPPSLKQWVPSVRSTTRKMKEPRRRRA